MMLDDLAKRIQSACMIQGRFTLRSGEITNRYFDKYLFEADPGLLRSVTAAMVELIPADTEVLAGLEMGAIAIVAALGAHTGLPCAFVRKYPKPHGTRRLAEGADVVGRRLLIVEDVITSGGQVIISANQLRELGATVDQALCVIDRSRDGAASLAADGITMRRLFRYADGVLHP
jgi:orotate phosphoribosyltransferase